MLLYTWKIFFQTFCERKIRVFLNFFHSLKNGHMIPYEFIALLLSISILLRSEKKKEAFAKRRAKGGLQKILDAEKIGRPYFNKMVKEN